VTCLPNSQRFDSRFPLATLALVDIRKQGNPSADGLCSSDSAGILANCRTALAFARRMGWPVAFVRSLTADPGEPLSNEWIGGFEPQQLDPVFDRRGTSCYSSPYFEDAVGQTAGAVVLAGFLGHGGCMSTAADAFQAGHRVTFLTDATLDDAADRAVDASMLQHLRTFAKFDISAVTTAAWIRAIEDFPVAIERKARRP
jgi:nicotinamidase-related amidase